MLASDIEREVRFGNRLVQTQWLINNRIMHRRSSLAVGGRVPIIKPMESSVEEEDPSKRHSARCPEELISVKPRRWSLT